MAVCIKAVLLAVVGHRGRVEQARLPPSRRRRDRVGNDRVRPEQREALQLVQRPRRRLQALEPR